LHLNVYIEASTESNQSAHYKYVVINHLGRFNTTGFTKFSLSKPFNGSVEGISCSGISIAAYFETVHIMGKYMRAYPSKNIWVVIVCSLAVLLATSTTATANGRWVQNHPRRTEVNARLGNQNRRIHQERREGEISRPQAALMHKQDRQIRREERQMALQNGGHITRQEQVMLNRQENQISREIGR